MNTEKTNRMMHTVESELLPPLGWIAQIDRETMRLRVTHGKHVETGPNFLVEGVWTGPFVDGRLDLADGVFGSGIVAHETRWIFVSSCSTTDYLYLGEGPGASLSVSNSLSLLLAHLDRRLDPSHPHYDRINESILLGISSYESCIPTTAEPVRRIMYQNLEVKQEGWNLIDKPMPPEFPDFAAYRGYLDRAYSELQENARDQHRSHRVSTLTTQSRGYDSTAVNAVAAPYGVDLALTVTAAKTTGLWTTLTSGDGESDDGTEICEVLGIEVCGLDRRSVLTGSEDEVLFHAGSHSCQDMNFMEAKKFIDGPALLLTGVFGELWYTDPWYVEHPDEMSNELNRQDLGGCGLGEVRLEWSFVQVALPFLGARRRTEICAITRSREMDEWRLGTAYDRPIARRLAEEGGVPRSLFGQKKLASVVQLPEPYFPVQPTLRRAFAAWLVDNHLVGRVSIRLRPLIHRYNSALCFKMMPRPGLIYYTERAISRVLGRQWEFSMKWAHLRGSLYCYSVNSLADRRARRGQFL